MIFLQYSYCFIAYFLSKTHFPLEGREEGGNSIDIVARQDIILLILILKILGILVVLD